MTWIKLRPTLPEDDRWLDAGPVAFAVHVAALCWCDQQLTDGAVSPPRVRRIANAFGIPPAQADSAAETLVDIGFWEKIDQGYQIVDYLKDQLAKEDIENTRARWAADKRRQRQHRAGDHSLCETARCPVRAAEAAKTAKAPLPASSKDKPKVQRGQRKSPVRKPPASRPPRPDPTRPDPKGGEGRGGRSVGSAAGDAAPSGSRRSSASPTGGPGGGPEPRCPHGVRGGLSVIVPGDFKPRFRCLECWAVAPEPNYRYNEWKRWIAEYPTVNIEVHCSDPGRDEVAQAVGRAALGNLGYLQDRGTPRDSNYARQLIAYTVEQLEPGRVAEALRSSAPHDTEATT